MAGLGPFGRRPRLAVAVSGGADSLALAWLTFGWTTAQSGDVLALVVDHGLRPESRWEAEVTARRLADCRIPAKILQISGLQPGPGLAVRAREARYAALAGACAAAGLADLLLGHHAEDQAETLMMRALAGGASGGFSGMAAQRETGSLRLLRPLLPLPPARLRATLREAGLDWVEDPSNRHATRGRLRALRAPDDGALAETASRAGTRRAASGRALADLLARRVSLFPEGYAVLAGGRLPAEALAALVTTISGASWPVSARRVARLAWEPRPATVAGVRLATSGVSLLILREEAAQAPPIPARRGKIWDGRFRLLSADLPGASLGALGADAARFRRQSPLPAVILRTLPALRRDGKVVSVPHLGYAGEAGAAMPRLLFCPAEPVSEAPWIGAPTKTGAIGDA